MNKIYKYDSDGIFSGEFIITDIYAPVPPGLNIAPPIVSGNQVAQRQDQNWVIIDQRLTKEISSVIPQSVSMRQAELALLEAGLLDDIELLIPSLPRADQISWKRASTVERSNPLVAYVQQAKGLTDLQIDDLFIRAATL